jgi:prepilin-type N-terminal cleavage/methylation domain-containing protein
MNNLLTSRFTCIDSSFAPMKTPARFRFAASGPLRSRRAGFSIIEIMIAVTIISLLAAIAVPTLKSVKRRTVATAIGNDLRTFAAAFDIYAHQNGRWPAEVAEGVMPPEMADRINGGAWLRPSPLGGLYNWDNGQLHAGKVYRAAIAISSSGSSSNPMDYELMEAIDRVIDDGNLTTGNFRLGADDEPVFIVAP